MTHITDQMLKTAIAAISDDQFDSHQVIRELMRSCPQKYVEELHEWVANADPIRITHQEIGRRLAYIARNGGGIIKLPRSKSPNVRSEPKDGTDNQRWKKVASQQT